MGQTYGLEVVSRIFRCLIVENENCGCGVRFCQSNPDLLQAIRIFLEVYFGIEGGKPTCRS